jgi:hypothetical protein
MDAHVQPLVTAWMVQDGFAQNLPEHLLDLLSLVGVAVEDIPSGDDPYLKCR